MSYSFEPTLSASPNYDPALAPEISKKFVNAIALFSHITCPEKMFQELNEIGARIARMGVVEGLRVIYNLVEGVSRTPLDTPFALLNDESSIALVTLALKPGEYMTAGGGQKLSRIGSELMFGIRIVASSCNTNEALFLPPVLKLENALSEYVRNYHGNKLDR